MKPEEVFFLSNGRVAFEHAWIVLKYRNWNQPDSFRQTPIYDTDTESHCIVCGGKKSPQRWHKQTCKECELEHGPQGLDPFETDNP